MSTFYEALAGVLRDKERWRRHDWPEYCFIVHIPQEETRLVIPAMAGDVIRSQYVALMQPLMRKPIFSPYTPPQHDMLAQDWERYGV